MEDKYYYIDYNNGKYREFSFLDENDRTVYIYPVAFEFDGKFYDAITGDEVVYSADGLYPGLSFFKKYFVDSDKLYQVISMFSLLNKDAIIGYRDWIRNLENASIERYSRYKRELSEIKKRRLVFKCYLEEEDNGK